MDKTSFKYSLKNKENEGGCIHIWITSQLEISENNPNQSNQSFKTWQKTSTFSNESLMREAMVLLKV